MAFAALLLENLIRIKTCVFSVDNPSYSTCTILIELHGDVIFLEVAVDEY